MEAVNVSKDWSREPCGTCNIGSVETWRQITKYMQISPFMYNAPTTFEEYPELWDIPGNIYTNTLNYGINCEITVGCDLTDFIISQRQIFQTVIQRQVAAIALRTMAMNPDVRVNRNQSNVSRMDILYELDGNTQGRPGGLGYDLKKAYEALSLDTQGLDRIACHVIITVFVIVQHKAGLQSIIDLKSRVVTFNEGLVSGMYIQRIITDNEAYIVDMNAEIQLYEEGVNRLGVSIMDYAPYRPLTIAIKEEKGQPTNRVTLRDTGDFESSFYIEVGDRQFEIKASDWKTEALIKKYGRQILGLTDENILSLIWDYIYPDLMKKAKEVILNK